MPWQRCRRRRRRPLPGPQRPRRGRRNGAVTKVQCPPRQQRQTDERCQRCERPINGHQRHSGDDSHATGDSELPRRRRRHHRLSLGADSRGQARRRSSSPGSHRALRTRLLRPRRSRSPPRMPRRPLRCQRLAWRPSRRVRLASRRCCDERWRRGRSSSAARRPTKSEIFSLLASASFRISSALACAASRAFWTSCSSWACALLFAAATRSSVSLARAASLLS